MNNGRQMGDDDDDAESIESHKERSEKEILDDGDEAITSAASAAVEGSVGGGEVEEPWIQVSGHLGIFLPIRGGRLWKRCMSKNRNEARIYRTLSADVALSSIVPKFYGEIRHHQEYYIEIENVLRYFKDPAIMDIKMGIRTYVEEEVSIDTKCKDLYEKMIRIDPNEPTIDEKRDSAITKVRYMKYREDLSSTSTLGFRIDAMKLPEDKKSRNNFWRVKTMQQVSEKLKEFLCGRDDTRNQIVNRLRVIRDVLGQSSLFRTHELIGSSLLIVYDDRRTGVWMIDFHNTSPIANGRELTHLSEWRLGNQEDGYLIGLDNLTEILLKLNV